MLLAYVALEGEQNRDHLRELFFPNASDAAGSLRSTLNRVRQILPTAFGGSGSRLKAAVACDAAEVLFALEHQDLEQAVELYTAPFLENLDISQVHPELLEWIETMRAYLARGIIEAHLTLAERAVEQLAVSQHLEAARNIIGFENLESTWLQRIVKLESLNLETLKPLVIPNNLSQNLTSFIGRARESAHILELLQEEARLVTLVGSGGVGKTRLALETARQSLQLEVFKDGVLMVMLEAINDLEALLSRIVQVLKLSLKPDAPVLEQIIEGIGQRKILLVLDNFEHLIEHGSHLTLLLEHCPNLRLIVTSRERLNLNSEWITPLEGLGAQSDQDAALELFLDRAARVGMRVQTFEDRAEALEICKLVHGFPLAIELAVPLLRALSLSELREDLSRNLDLLDNTLRNTPERHRSIRAVFEHSWKMLSTLEQHALAQLAVFRGGATREAIGAINATKLQTLANLTDKSLMQRDATSRFGIHPLLYQFTLEKLLELPDFAGSFERHQDYYLTKLERDTAQIRGSDAANAMRNIETELENIRAAWSHAIQNNQAQRLEKVQDLVVFFDQRSRYAEGLIWFEEAIAKLEMDASTPLALAGMLVSAAWLHYRLRQSHEAEQKAQRAADLARAMGEVAEEILSKALNTLGSIFLGVSKHKAAISVTEEALSLIQKSEGNSREALLLVNLATMQAQVGEYDKAERRLFQALKVSQTLGDKNVELLARINLGNLFLFSLEKLNLHEILEILEPGLLLAKELQSKMMEAHFDLHTGICHFKLKNYEKSYKHSSFALKNGKLVRDLGVQVSALLLLGRLYLTKNNLVKAHNQFIIGGKLANQIDDTSQVLDCLLCFAEFEILSQKEQYVFEILNAIPNNQFVQTSQKKEAHDLLLRLNFTPFAISQIIKSSRPIKSILEDILKN